jgi:predicted nucleotidyltransferase
MDSNVNLIVERLKKISYCEGIVYSGSRTDGDFVATSDYDFTVLVSKGKSYYKIFRYKNLLVDICCATEKVIIKQDFRRDKVANPELSIIAHGEILFDKAGQMKAIQKKAQRVWKLGPKNDIKEAGHLCTIFLHKLNKPRSDSAYHSWNIIMDETVRLFFELHKVWLPKPLKVESTINEIDGAFFKLYKKIYLADSKNRVQFTKQMIQYLIKKFDLPQTCEIYFLKDEN